jgi:hypothetical protein
MTAALSFVHKFEPGSDPTRAPILLLHGTGGDESDLLPLGRAIAPGAALLAPRGKVIENGMPRFFRRLREGVFNEEDVRRGRTNLPILSVRRAEPMALLSRSLSAFPTGPMSRPLFFCCVPKCLMAR